MSWVALLKVRPDADDVEDGERDAGQHDREDRARRVDRLDALEPADQEIGGVEYRQPADHRDPADHERGPGVGNDAERRLEAGAAGEEILRDQHEERGGGERRHDLPDEDADHAADADHEEKMAERVDAGAYG